MNSPEVNAQNGVASASPIRGSEAGHDGAAPGSTQPTLATSVSSKKAEANRRNAQHSTGPTSEAGKAVSRLNAVKHGLLTKQVVITRGDYQENAEEYAQLLEELTEQFEPEGIAEALEVQKIALAYWR